VTEIERERFWAKVQKSASCWLWTGARLPFGYGQLSVASRVLKAHRVSWELHLGPIPAGAWVLHRCDNPPCVNPDHLFLGTHTENMADMAAKGRRAKQKGEAHGRAKLSDAQAQTIRFLCMKTLLNQCAIARLFGVSRSIIGRIERRQAWSHLSDIARD